jgi:transcriptional regulator with XRE-family HTH domain
MQIGLTQTGLAELLHLTKRAVGEWEAGSAYPKMEHLKALITLALQHGAFAAGQKAEEIRALWQAAHQKVLLDERWLQELVQSTQPPALTPVAPPVT